jgi:hypothetical protein
MMVGVFVLALMGEDSMELSRFRAAAGARLSQFSFEGDIGAAAAN